MLAKRILRKREVLERLGIGKTAFHESFIKTGRLRFVKIGPRAVGVIEDCFAPSTGRTRVLAAMANAAAPRISVT